MEPSPAPLPNGDAWGERSPDARITPVERLHDELHGLYQLVGEPTVRHLPATRVDWEGSSGALGGWAVVRIRC